MPSRVPPRRGRLTPGGESACCSVFLGPAAQVLCEEPFDGPDMSMRFPASCRLWSILTGRGCGRIGALSPPHSALCHPALRLDSKIPTTMSRRSQEWRDTASYIDELSACRGAVSISAARLLSWSHGQAAVFTAWAEQNAAADEPSSGFITACRAVDERTCRGANRDSASDSSRALRRAHSACRDRCRSR
jgi:hypothetical protein